MLELIKKRLYYAFTTSIDPLQFILILIPIAILLSILLLVGFQSVFLKIRIERHWIETIKTFAIALIVPGLTEEIFFRVLLLPHPSENASITEQIIWIFISLISFIVYHPIQGLTWNKAGRDVFLNSNFLSLATILGLICTIAYLGTGTIWLPLIIHSLAVAIWLNFLDGFSKFNNVR